MPRMIAFLVMSAALAAPLFAAEKAQSPKEALQAFNELIGSWKGTGMPESGTAVEKRKSFWMETIAWDWQFKGNDAWLNLTFSKGKYFDKGSLRYVPTKDIFQLQVSTPEKEALTFEGKLDKKNLTLERDDDKKKETQRLVITMLHENRYLYRYETKPKDRNGGFTKVYQVGATKEGVPFAAGDGRPECVVSGGVGTTKVTFNGKDYYVCCSGCRDAFKEEPEKYVREFEEKKKKK